MKETTIIWEEQFQSDEDSARRERLRQEVERWLRDELSR